MALTGSNRYSVLRMFILKLKSGAALGKQSPSRLSAYPLQSEGQMHCRLWQGIWLWVFQFWSRKLASCLIGIETSLHMPLKATFSITITYRENDGIKAQPVCFNRRFYMYMTTQTWISSSGDRIIVTIYWVFQNLSTMQRIFLGTTMPILWHLIFVSTIYEISNSLCWSLSPSSL